MRDPHTNPGLHFRMADKYPARGRCVSAHTIDETQLPSLPKAVIDRMAANNVAKRDEPLIEAYRPFLKEMRLWLIQEQESVVVPIESDDDTLI
jgi:hypothetical protein